MAKKTTKYEIKLERLFDLEQKKETSRTVVFATGEAKVFEPKKLLSISEIQELMIYCSWILDCIDVITREVIKFPLYVSPKGKGKEVQSLLDYPSLTKPLCLIRKQYLTDMLLYGNGGCQIVYKKGIPTYLVPVPGYTIRVKEGKKEEEIEYTFTDVKTWGGFKTKESKDKKKEEPIVLKLKEFMHFAIDAMSDQTLAMSPVDRISNVVKTDKNILAKMVAFSQRGFINPHILLLPQAGKKDLEKFVEFLSGIFSEGKKLVGINKEGNAIELKGWSAKDIIDLQRWIGLRVANVFHIPPFMLNLVEDVGSLNAREQRARFLENVILPILEYETHLYTTILVRLGFEKDDIIITSPLIGTRLNYDRARIARMLVGTDDRILTPEEARVLFFGLPPKPVKYSGKNKK